MKATYTFTAFGDTHAHVLSYVKRVADTYWGHTPYKVISIASGQYGADVVTQALEAVAS